MHSEAYVSVNRILTHSSRFAFHFPASTNMNNLRAQLTLGAICLLLGVMMVMQFRSQRQIREEVPRSTTDQATYISQLYESNTELQQQVDELNGELARYRQDVSGGKSNLDSVTRDIQSLRMANGEVEVTGPGVTVLADGDVTVLELQDLVNELRNASAEAIAVNEVRLTTRSAIAASEDGRITIDRQPISRPYRLEAIGDHDTLVPALERKGGLIALLKAGDSSLQIQVSRHDVDDQQDWLKLPATALVFPWEYVQAAP
jgi:uncharacterized protein YlxW (UPF0749 family)